MAPTSRTVNPLHFEDLEPHRFEDLVRQIVYDFRPWRRLEATGRAGSDDGFDARGYEIAVSESNATEDDGEEVSAERTAEDRQWLIQCKREKTIGPKALLNYLDAIPRTEIEKLDGLLFVAASEFSKKARDAFYARCVELHIPEAHIWGKGELEDQLFQAKNDHLLFAYFGFSLQIRKRSQRSEIRGALAMKRKAHRMLEDHSHDQVLLRSSTDRNYPYEADVPDFVKRPPWRVISFEGFYFSGLKFRIALHLAFLAEDGKTWDAAMRVDEQELRLFHQDPWAKPVPDDQALREKGNVFWRSLSEDTRAHLTVYGYVPYDDVIDIDDLGDEYFEGPHIYLPFENDGLPFAIISGDVNAVGPRSVEANGHLYPSSADDRRAVIFPEELR